MNLQNFPPPYPTIALPIVDRDRPGLLGLAFRVRLNGPAHIAYVRAIFCRHVSALTHGPNADHFQERMRSATARP
jgi:hypothetical protein